MVPVELSKQAIMNSGLHDFPEKNILEISADGKFSSVNCNGNDLVPWSISLLSLELAASALRTGKFEPV
jgi:hypothetical protein